MKHSRLSRRHFVTSTLMAGAATAILPGTALALWQKDLSRRLPQDPNAIVALIKRRLPNATLDEQSLHNYAADLVRRVTVARDTGASYYRAIFTNTADTHQLEHFVVQDFLLRSDALLTAHLKQPITYKNA